MEEGWERGRRGKGRETYRETRRDGGDKEGERDTQRDTYTQRDGWGVRQVSPTVPRKGFQNLPLVPSEETYLQNMSLWKTFLHQVLARCSKYFVKCKN